jgi:hypothetical protein
MVTLRIDLDYVPWDTPDAAAFGHAEPAMVLRLLELARKRGVRYHFFISNRSLRAFPALVDCVLGEGHDLDWLMKRPDQQDDRWDEARRLAEQARTQFRGWAIRGELPVSVPEEIEFVSAPVLVHPRTFLTQIPSLREGLRAGQSLGAWEVAMTERVQLPGHHTVRLHPQVLGHADPSLKVVTRLLELCTKQGIGIRTLRQLVREDSSSGSS